MKEANEFLKQSRIYVLDAIAKNDLNSIKSTFEKAQENVPQCAFISFLLGYDSQLRTFLIHAVLNKNVLAVQFFISMTRKPQGFQARG